MQPTLSVGRPGNRSRIAEIRRDWWPPVLALGLGIVFVLIAYAPTVMEMVRIWGNTATYSYGWAVLPTFALAIAWNRGTLRGSPPRASLAGVALAGVAALTWLIGEVIHTAEARHFAFVLGLWALALATFGVAHVRRLMPSLLLLVFLVPTGQFLLLPLRAVTAGFVEIYARLAGLPFSRDGFTLFVDTHRYVVIDACAGLPYLLIGALLGVTFGALNFRTLWKALAFGALGAGLGIMANGIRVIAITAYDTYQGTQMDLVGHKAFELPGLALMFGVLLIVHTRVRSERIAPPDAPSPGAGRWPVLRAIAVPAASAIVLAAAPLLISSAPAPGSAAVPPLPEQIAGWSRLAPVTTDWAPRSLHAAKATKVRYRHDNGGDVTLFRAVATTPTEKITAGSVDVRGVGDHGDWMPGATEPTRICGDAGCVNAVYERIVLKDSTRARHLLWLYSVGEVTMRSSLAVRARRAWGRLKGEPRPAVVVAVMQETAGPTDPRIPAANLLPLINIH